MIAAVSYFFQLLLLFSSTSLFLYRHGVDIYNLFSGLFSASPLAD